MKLTKLNTLTALLLTSSLGFTAAGIAANKMSEDRDVQRSVIKIEAEQGEGVVVLAGENGIKNKYELSFEELENMDNVAAKLGDLDEETKTKILDLLAQVKSSDSKIIEFKDADIMVDGAETQVFMVKTGNGEDQMHVEIDVEGEGANTEKRVFVKRLLGEGKKHNKVFRHHMRKGEKRDPAAVIKKIIDKAELTDEQIAEIKAALESK